MFERYHRELLNVITRAVGDRDRAADVVQEAFVRVLALHPTAVAAAATGGAGNNASRRVREPRALLYRTAKNIVIDEHRRSQVRDHDSLDHPDAAQVAAASHAQPEEQLEARQAARCLLAAIDALPPRCKEAFVLYKLDGMPQAEIAERMGITRNAVEKHVIAGMVACRRAMDEGAL